MIQSVAETGRVSSTLVRSAPVSVVHAEQHEAAVIEVLRCYEKELQHLRVENEQLRRSALMFGELAERLNIALRIAAASMDQTGDDSPSGPV